MNLVIYGNCIAKKNSQRIVKIGKRHAIRPSIAYEKYAKQAGLQLMADMPYTGEYPVVVEMFFYRETERKFDLDNMQGAVLDVLVNTGIIADDSMRHVIPRIHAHGWSVDRNRPRTIVEIYQYRSFSDVGR